ncbi:MAG TPA: hypothetical protein VF433_01240 [Cellvibrio sp.]
MKLHKLIILGLGISLSVFASNENNLEAVDTSLELPNILYVVPWKEGKDKKVTNPKLVLHDLMGDLYEPQLASDWKSH